MGKAKALSDMKPSRLGVATCQRTLVRVYIIVHVLILVTVEPTSTVSNSLIRLSINSSTTLIVSNKLAPRHGRLSGSQFTRPSDGSSSTSRITSSHVREHVVLYITLYRATLRLASSHLRANSCSKTHTPGSH